MKNVYFRENFVDFPWKRKMLSRTSLLSIDFLLKVLRSPFHSQTAGLSMMYMNTSRNKANRLNYESFILFHIRKHHRPLKASTWQR
jgi:hypothetical protein